MPRRLFLGLGLLLGALTVAKCDDELPGSSALGGAAAAFGDDGTLRLIFSVNSGRSGSAFLAALLSALCAATTSVHESQPNMSGHVMRRAALGGLAATRAERAANKLPVYWHKLNVNKKSVLTNNGAQSKKPNSNNPLLIFTKNKAIPTMPRQGSGTTALLTLPIHAKC